MLRASMTYNAWSVLLAVPVLLICAGTLTAQPVVTSVSPANGRISTDAIPVITVTFDRPVANMSLSSFIISGAATGKRNNGAGLLVPNGAATAFAFTPAASAPLLPGERVNVTLTTAITELGTSAPMAEPYVWSFIVGAAAGPNNFSACVAFGEVDSTFEIELCDINGDGHIDILMGAEVTNYSGQDHYYLNDGQGGFAWAGSMQPLGAHTEQTKRIITADFNIDGRPDIFQMSSQFDEYIFWNGGAGTPGGAPTLAPEALTVLANGGWSASVGDVNGDSYPDIVLTEITSTVAGCLTRVYTNDGTVAPGFAATSDVSSGRFTRWTALADLNNDGALDLIEGNLTTQAGGAGQNYVMFNNGQGAFTAGDLPFGTSTGKTHCVAAADMNLDGWVDIIAGNQGEQSYVYLSNAAPSPNLLFTEEIPVNASVNNVASIAVADADDDGAPDIICGGSASTGSICYSSGGAHPTFSAIDFGDTVTTDFLLTDFATGDLDGDGDIDIAAAGRKSAGPNDNRLFFNEGVAVPAPGPDPAPAPDPNPNPDPAPAPAPEASADPFAAAGGGCSLMRSGCAWAAAMICALLVLAAAGQRRRSRQGV